MANMSLNEIQRCKTLKLFHRTNNFICLYRKLNSGFKASLSESASALFSFRIVDVQLLKPSSERPKARPGNLTFADEEAASIYQRVFTHKCHEKGFMIKIPNPTVDIEYMKKLAFISAVCTAVKKSGYISKIFIFPFVLINTGELVPRVNVKKPCGKRLISIWEVFTTVNLTVTESHAGYIKAFMEECGMQDPEAVETVMKVFNTLNHSIDGEEILQEEQDYLDRGKYTINYLSIFKSNLFSVYIL